MLKLIDIKKDYIAGDTVVHALKGVSLEFREHEFVAVLGHSGCGKTTLLNIIGGLDQYSSGDLIINGRSTKNYSDADWDDIWLGFLWICAASPTCLSASTARRRLSRLETPESVRASSTFASTV